MSYIGPNATVTGTAIVRDNATVTDSAIVTDNAIVRGTMVIDRSPMTVTRSDGYTFLYAPCADGIWRVSAGCRYFTMEEAETHWSETRGDTPLGQETMIILIALGAWRLLCEEQS